ncbi:sensor histidine kinase [Cohnella sp. 56]|uniref:sensor histidine kinase n=1 Tax=Cohnella sp. 56 TaxID=3113722 RepID=UPI0030E978C4
MSRRGGRLRFRWAVSAVIIAVAGSLTIGWYVWSQRQLATRMSEYEQGLLRETALLFADRAKDRQLGRSALTEEDRAWLQKECTLNGLNVRLLEGGDERRELFASAAPSILRETREEPVPLIYDGELAGYLEVSYAQGHNQSLSWQRLQRSLHIRWTQLAVLLAIIVALGLWAGRRLAAGIERLGSSAEQLRLGEPPVAMPPSAIAELAQLSGAIDRLQLELDGQETIRVQLLQDLTHELRTPITSLLMELEAMMDGVYEATPERLAEIYEELERLTRLVRQMEQLFEAEGARYALQIDQHDMLQLMKTVHRNFGPIAAEKGVRLALALPLVPCAAEVDADRVIQIVSNLLSNAVKFTPAGAKVELSLDCGADFVDIGVADEGIGIAEAEQGRIFERFYRAERFKPARIEGMGVGLAIVKALVEAHDGAIAVDSRRGEGARFRVRLPVRYKAGAPAKPSS